MPGDEDDAIARQFLGQRHRLIGVTEIVAHDQLDPLAEHATLGVEIRNRQLGGALILLAEPGQSTGHVAGDADPDVGVRRPRPERPGRDHADDQQSRADHARPLRHCGEILCTRAPSAAMRNWGVVRGRSGHDVEAPG